MIKVSWHAMQRWINDGIQPRDYVFAAWLDHHVSKAEDLPEAFLEYDWQQSHGVTLVVFCDELITVQTLKVLHQYFRHQSCDIENIIIVTSHAVGVADWWKQYVALHQERSFNIQEWLIVRTMRWQKFFQGSSLPDRNELDKNIQRLFNSYSGTNARLDRQYLALKLRGLGDIGVVDMMSDFSTTRQQLVNHAYYLGYFKNGQEEELIQALYDQYVHDSRLVLDGMISHIAAPKTNPGDFDGQSWQLTMPAFAGCKSWQYQLDRLCLATVVNETNNIEPWCMISEKTLRPFWHHCAVIHPGYQSTARLEAMGFWFPHDIFDYSYQHEPDWLTRLNKMIASIQATHDAMAGRYQEYWSDNYERFRHNALLMEQHQNSDI